MTCWVYGACKPGLLARARANQQGPTSCMPWKILLMSLGGGDYKRAVWHDIKIGAWQGQGEQPVSPHKQQS